MADHDPILVPPSPFEIDQRLRSRLTEALLAQGGFRHATLNAYLRERLSGNDIARGALLGDPAIEGAAGYVSSGVRPAELIGGLLHPKLVEALTWGEPGEDYRFDHPAYAHQLEAWRLLSGSSRDSVLVSSGTGSGKTECFLVPLLDDLAREAESEGPLVGVRAIMLYPLNALIASQQERLRRWTKPFAGQIRFALYNGQMLDKRKHARDQAEGEWPEQVLYRTTLRQTPPPILVTNNTMLEYLTIRREDQPIIDASRGKLRWIIIDEAHSYVGSAAAEVSLLLRRVLNIFGVEANQVRFVATSATIGGIGDEARADLQRYLADLAGVSAEHVHVVFGSREKVNLPPADKPASLAPLLGNAAALARQPLVQHLVRAAEAHGIGLGEVARECTSADIDPRTLLEAIAGRRGSHPLLPLRIHKFVRSVPGLWSCLNPGCGVERPQDWPFGGIFFEQHLVCRDCKAPVFEIIGCRECGEPWLNAFDHGDRLLPGEHANDEDEFAQASDREDEGADSGAAEEPEPHAGISGARRLIATRPLERIGEHAVDLTTGALPDRRSTGTTVGMSPQLFIAACPHCGAPPNDNRASPLRSFRFGAPFLIQNAAPTMLEGVSPARDRSVAIPAEGRQLLSFTDSRQGTARFAASIETMSERGAVRALVYHLVQRRAASSSHSTDERQSLEETVRALGQAVKTHPILQGSLDEARAKLAGTDVPKALAWNDAIRALAEEPLVNQWIRKVWDRDRDERYHTNPEALAHFLLLRELARRPRRANALETLGFAQLRFDHIDRLSETSLPETFKRKGLMIEDWRNFLYYLLDSPLRAYFVLRIDRDDARWLVPKRAFLRHIVGPDEEKQRASDLRWPRARTIGTKSNAVMALERGLQLDSSEASDCAEINDVLETAWRAVHPLLEGDGSARALDIRRAGIAPVRDAWLCPITHRVLSRLLFGRSQYGVDGRALRSDIPPEPIVLPRLPSTLPQSEAERRELARFVDTDPEIATLRARGAWGDLHDRAASFAPYMRVEEHSAQQPPHRLREFEREFKDHQINMLACSTTMEMGVDIGSVEAVLNTNVPPSIANYRQRVGRAGRRGQSFSSSLTLARDTPLDRETFRDPVRYLRRELRAPKVTLDSPRIVQRHVNALLLAAWLRQAEGQLTRIKVGEFYGFPQKLDLMPDEEPPAERFITWLRDPSTETSMAASIHRLIKGTALQLDMQVAENAAGMFQRARDAFGSEWHRLREQLAELAPEARASIEIRVRRMTGEPLLKELANASLLPGHGFPTSVLLFDNSCRETQDRTHRVTSDEDREVSFDKRYEYPSRTSDIAIREYAPGAEVVIDGLVWTSAGVTLNWKRPASDANAREIQSIRVVWSCGDCRETGTSRISETSCPACGSVSISNSDFLEPAGFRVDWRAKPHAETDRVHYIEPIQPRVSARGADWEPLPNPTLGRLRAAGDGLVFHASCGEAKLGYQICLDCGRAAEPGSNDLSDHEPLTPPKGHQGRCTGNDKTYAITAPIMLGHEVLTDVAELQLFGLMDPGAGWALASALRETLARRLGIEPRELGLSLDKRVKPLGEDALSIFLFDQSSGGAGYAPRIGDNIGELLRDARQVLDCAADCERACSTCVLTADLHAQQKIINRIPALELVERLLTGLAGPDPADIVWPTALLAPPAADALARQLRPGDIVCVFLAEVGDLGAIATQPLTGLFAAAARTGAQVRVVIPEMVLDTFDEAFRCGLRNASHRHDFTLWKGVRPTAPNGAVLIAALQAGTTTGFFTRDLAAGIAGPDWGKGHDHPIISASMDQMPEMSPVPEEELERPLGAGDRVLIVPGDSGRAVRLFGSGFVSQILKGELEAAGLWRPGELAEIAYSDRYLKAPLPVLLMMQVASALRDVLAPAGTQLPLSIKTEPLRPRGNYRPSVRLKHDWTEDDDRAEVVEGIATALGMVCSYDDSGAAHGRKLTLRYRDGSEALILLDQGFGYWRAQQNDRHDFRASPSQQVKSLLASTTFVSGKGESYIAVAKGN